MDDCGRKLSLESGADLRRRRRRILLAESRGILGQLHPGGENCAGGGSTGGRGGVGSEVHRGEEGEKVEADCNGNLQRKTGVHGDGAPVFLHKGVLFLGSNSEMQLGIHKHIFQAVLKTKKLLYIQIPLVTGI